MIQLNSTQIECYAEVCSYCMEVKTTLSCCEENHFEEVIVTVDGYVYLSSEVEVLLDE